MSVCVMSAGLNRNGVTATKLAEQRLGFVSSLLLSTQHSFPSLYICLYLLSVTLIKPSVWICVGRKYPVNPLGSTALIVSLQEAALQQNICSKEIHMFTCIFCCTT